MSDCLQHLQQKMELQTCHIFTILTSIGYERPSPVIHHHGHVLRAVQGIRFSNGASKRLVAPSSHFRVQRTWCFSHIFQVSHTPRSVPSFQDPSRSLPMYSDHGSPGPNVQIQSRMWDVNECVFRFKGSPINPKGMPYSSILKLNKFGLFGGSHHDTHPE